MADGAINVVLCFVFFFTMSGEAAQGTIGILRSIIFQAEKDVSAGKYEQAAQALSGVIANARSNPTARAELGTALNDLADAYRELHRLSDAQALLKEALTTSEQIADSKMQIAVLNNLGLVLQLQGSFAEADRTFQKSLLKARSQSGLKQSLLYAQILDNIGQLRIDEGKLKQAESEFREALRIRRRLADSNGPEVAESLNSIAGLYSLRGRYDKAEPLYRQALTATERSFGQKHLRVAAMLASLGGLYLEQHRFDEAESFLRRALEIRQAALPPEHPAIARTLLYLGATQRDAGHYEDAASTLRQAVASSRATYPSNDPRIADALELLAAVLTTLNKPADAAPIQGEALRIRAFLQYKSPSSVPPPKPDGTPEGCVASRSLRLPMCY